MGWESQAASARGRPGEIALFAEAKNNGGPSDGLTLVYLVEIDSEATDDEAVDPGKFPPARN